MNITVYLGASNGVDKMYSMEAKALGEWIGKSGHRLIYGGSRTGLMGVLADAVLSTGGEVIGVEPAFFIESELQHDSITQLIVTESMAERREKMIELGDAFIAFPGGTGTLEEISEVISLVKLGHIDHPVVFLNLEHYYDPMEVMYRKMVEEGFLERVHLEKIHFSTSVEGAASYLAGTWDRLKKGKKSAAQIVGTVSFPK